MIKKNFCNRIFTDATSRVSYCFVISKETLVEDEEEEVVATLGAVHQAVLDNNPGKVSHVSYVCIIMFTQNTA